MMSCILALIGGSLPAGSKEHAINMILEQCIS